MTCPVLANSVDPDQLASEEANWSGSALFVIKYVNFYQQEAHGPRVAHLSDIATADIQILCNIFPILSSQLMKRSSFKQILILKKNIYKAYQSMERDHLNKL